MFGRRAGNGIEMRRKLGRIERGLLGLASGFDHDRAPWNGFDDSLES